MNHHQQSLKKDFANFQKYHPQHPTVNSFNLKEEELFLIKSYAGSWSSWVNSDPRSGIVLKDKCKIIFASLLENSLRKMPSFNSNTVFRMDKPHTDNNSDVLFWFENKIGCSFTLPIFLSTSKEEWDDDFYPITWEIKTISKNSFGKDISLLLRKFEEEVLFNRGAKFKIIDVDFKKSKINLSELENGKKTDFELLGRYWENIE